MRANTAQARARQPAAKHIPSCAVIGPDGQILTPGDLPRQAPQRWVPRRKAEVALAVMHGLASLPDLRRRYALPFDEMLAWMMAYQNGGLAGLECRHQRNHENPHPNMSEELQDHGQKSRPVA